MTTPRRDYVDCQDLREPRTRSPRSSSRRLTRRIARQSPSFQPNPAAIPAIIAFATDNHLTASIEHAL